jgi:glycosyltransferase involved in cell wall biosynthesis
MRIAQVAPLFESVPPKTYGGTERIVSYLTEELVRLGHDVTLFASGDSKTSARLVSPYCCALRLDSKVEDPIVHHFNMMEMVQNEIENFDIIHYHIDYLHFPLSRRSMAPHITTLHGRLDLADLQFLYNEYKEMPVVSISNSQRIPLSQSNWKKTIYHGLPPDLYRPTYSSGSYLAFIGRFSPEKGPEKAIEIAKKIGIPLKIAAKVDKKDQAYFEEVIMPLLDHPLIENIGEIGESEKEGFLGNALALLFPINWPEPFGLVMIESMACGTPVIAFDFGSVQEIMEDGISGHIVHSVDEAVQAVANIDRIERKGVRDYFDRRFSSVRMAMDYVDLYEEMAKVKSLSDRAGNLNFY